MESLPWRRVAVVAPHPDDEILGCGGTIARLAAEGAEVHVVIVTRGQPPQFDEALVEQVRREAACAHELIGVSQTHYLDFPAAGLDRVPAAELNGALSKTLSAIDPDALFVPFIGDIHLDHQIVFNAALVHARPRSRNYPVCVLAYETLSETNWLAPGITPGFLPNVFVDISDTLDKKIASFGLFASQVKAHPDERSFESIRALALLRGAAVYRDSAEAFMMIRYVL
jgi:LmbE family N-acetylglucosaminyl deacetylase